jgi:hypothetical protein
LEERKSTFAFETTTEAERSLIVEDAWETPKIFDATTVKVYEIPFVRPVTIQLDAGAVAVQVRPPGLEVTV